MAKTCKTKNRRACDNECKRARYGDLFHICQADKERLYSQSKAFSLWSLESTEIATILCDVPADIMNTCFRLGREKFVTDTSRCDREETGFKSHLAVTQNLISAYQVVSNDRYAWRFLLVRTQQPPSHKRRITNSPSRRKGKHWQQQMTKQTKKHRKKGPKQKSIKRPKFSSIFRTSQLFHIWKPRRKEKY